MATTSTTLHQFGISPHQRLRKDMDIHYPTSLSMQPRLSLPTESYRHTLMTKVLKRDIKRISRHRTQPLTFDEIKEVDEDNLEDIQIQSKVLNTVGVDIRKQLNTSLSFGALSEMDKARPKEV